MSFYNYSYLHSALGKKSPQEYEQLYLEKEFKSGNLGIAFLLRSAPATPLPKIKIARIIDAYCEGLAH